MLDFINSFLGIDLFEIAGMSFGILILCFFGLLALDFMIQLLLIFWRWIFHAK